jgi:hypothetical protein
MRKKLIEHRSSPLAKPFGRHQLRDLGGDLAAKRERPQKVALLFDNRRRFQNK